ncbi:hypothetical protein [Arthrobacter glacialis]|uniref:hypothetical protein n=1 Tax=Arthrobacter glacialis TaxID=1664 RepID=UPI001056F7AB|nr:hypothetical protein [Arthrobacter glacialis]
MTVTWTPRLDITNNKKVMGWLTLNPVKTEVLPRIGEAVSFSDDLLPPEMHLNSSLSYSPTVSRVEHAVGGTDGWITVVVVVEIGGSVDRIGDLAKSSGLGWLSAER